MRLRNRGWNLRSEKTGLGPAAAPPGDAEEDAADEDAAPTLEAVALGFTLLLVDPEANAAAAAALLSVLWVLRLKLLMGEIQFEREEKEGFRPLEEVKKDDGGPFSVEGDRPATAAAAGEGEWCWGSMAAAAAAEVSADVGWPDDLTGEEGFR